MKLYLMRHCEPLPGVPMDGARKLTEEGRRQAGEMGAFMARQVGRVDIVICSPFARAVETAAKMGEALGAHVVTSKMLEPDGMPGEMWKEITRLAQASREVLVVGHDPSLNALLAWLVGAADDDDEKFEGIRFAHGAVAHLKIKNERDGKLHWLATVPMVERDTAETEVVEAALAAVSSLAG